MKEFHALRVGEKEIVLKSKEELAQLKEEIEKNNDFILVWEDAEKELSKVFIAENFMPQVKSGTVTLSAEGKKR